MSMPDVSPDKLARYLSGIFRGPVRVCSIAPLGDPAGEIKAYGYGMPLRVDFEADGARRVAVLHTIKAGGFGHDDMSDRARELLWQHRAFNGLPRHIRSLDVGGFLQNGSLIPLGHVEEFCLLTEYAQGSEYAADLERIAKTGALSGQDTARAEALCDYLAEIHQTRRDDPPLYLRRIRELVGGDECIMGLADSYPASMAAPLEQAEHLCIGWRWRLKRYTHRLRQVHGDFHPWNVLFGAGAEFTLLDRSRGEFGDPADDVTSLTLNYAFFSLQRSGRLEGSFEHLFRAFWDRYLDRTGDREMLQVAAPFCAFRALVMASPVWYPKLSEPVRTALTNFAVEVLSADAFNPAEVNRYCGV